MQCIGLDVCLCVVCFNQLCVALCNHGRVVAASRECAPRLLVLK